MIDAEPIEPPWGTCDWGGCNCTARRWRYSTDLAEWLPVCAGHSPAEEHQ